MKIGIMGGTFNPVHVGHLTLAEWAREALQLDEVWFIPTGISYSKKNVNVLPGMERLQMTELAVSDNPHFKCLDIEVQRGGYTYSYETLEQLRDMYPENKYFFLLGADCLFTLENWKYPERLLAACTIAAVVRGNVPTADMEAKRRWLENEFDAEIELLPFINIEISSTEIRKRAGEGKSIRYLVPEKVRKYIEEKGFYREEGIYHN